MKLGRCRQFCDASVEWVITERNARPMALDVDATPDGNVVMVATPAGPRARVYGAGVTPGDPGPRRTPHAATCPREADPVLLAKRRAATALRYGTRRTTARRPARTGTR